MSHHGWDYLALMREHGYRVTLQRQLILDAVCEGRGHTTFKEIYERARAKAPTINRTTVYRTLNFLCELRLVVAADIGNGRRVYEIAGDTPHHHLVCRRCGRVEQISHDVVRALLAAIERKSRFKVDMDHLVLLGLCPKCRHAEYGNET